MKYLGILLTALLYLACATGEASECEETRNHNDPLCYKSDLITVWADESFGNEKKLLVMRSFDKWSMRTEGRVRFDVRFVSANNLSDRIDQHNVYYVYNRDPGPGFLGYATWMENRGAVISMHPALPVNDFQMVMLHEIGHALSLGHYEGTEPSIMDVSSSIYADVYCVDIRNFCAKWDCIIPCEE